MDKESIIQETEKHIKAIFEGEQSGHDWWHVYRVRRIATHIAIQEQEKVDLFIIQLAALLHDIADWKFHDGDISVGPKMAREWLEQFSVDEESLAEICEIIERLSFKGGGVISSMSSKEGEIVQDADRLDAIGAIGIARVFAYGGSKGREIHNPDFIPDKHETFEQYKNGRRSSVNHFYEKLLLLKDQMNTKEGRRLAEERHIFLEQYLEEFFQEWNLEDCCRKTRGD